MYRAVYLLIHAIFRVLTAIVAFLLLLEQYANGLFRARTTRDENEQLEIELGKRGLIKVPQHIAIIFNNSNQQLEPLGRLVRWIILTGVRYISFYDFRGNLIEIRPDIVKRLEEIKKETTQPDGLLDAELEAKFFYLNSRLNTSLIRNACQELCKPEVKPSDISIPLVDECLRKLLPEYSDPDLAIYFDDHCCTYGLSPWHIRLTEFAQVKLDARLKVENYLNILYKYSKCEQRFGK